MSINFASLPFGVYQGKLVSKAYSRFNQSGSIVGAKVDFSQYAVGGEGLGNANPNFAVQVNFQASATVPQPFLVASIFIDNLGNTVPVYVYFPDTGYCVDVPADAQGWFPVISNAPAAWIICENMVTGQLPVVNVFFTDLYVPPYSNVAQPSAIEQNLASPLISIGGGAPLQTINIVNSGSSYNGGGLAITGGGGSGATAAGTLDAYGRFTAVTVEAPGEGFTGLPIITPTGSIVPPVAYSPSGTYTAGFGNFLTYDGTVWYFNGGSQALSISCGAAAWVNGLGYSVGQQVNYAGLIYVCVLTYANGSMNLYPPTTPSAWRLVGSATPNTSYNWVNTGVVPGVAASFQAVLGNATTAAQLITQGYGAPALGDQSTNFIDTVTGTGVFRTNLFGTPYASGYIYLTHIDVRLFNAGECEWTLGTAGYALYQLQSYGVNEQLLDIQKANIKLDATATWELDCTGFTSNAIVQHALVWTYSQTG